MQGDFAGGNASPRRGVFGNPGETGICLVLGTVYGVDGLKIGGGGGGIGYGICACACLIVPPKKDTHPATTNFASIIRSNLVNCIALYPVDFRRAKSARAEMQVHINDCLRYLGREWPF